jgi:hypothetical protein
MVGGSLLRTVPLDSNEWTILLGMSSLLIPWDLCRKLLVVKFFPQWLQQTPQSPAAFWRAASFPGLDSVIIDGKKS